MALPSTPVIQAIELWKRGQWREAEQACTAALNAAADDIDGLTLLSEIQAATGRPGQSAAVLRRLARLRPNDAAIQRRLGGLCLAAGQTEDAIAALQQAIELEPANPRSHNNLGQAYMKKRQPRAALQAYDRALELNSSYALGYNNRGIALGELGLVDEAVRSFERAIELNPQFGEAYHNCGNALCRSQRTAEALVYYARAIELLPGRAEPYLSRATLLLQLRRPEAALSDFERALHWQPEDAIAWSNRANALLELHRPDEALQCCERATLLRPDLAQAHNNTAGALRALNRQTEALEACDRALALNPDYVEAWCNRGALLEDLLHPERARECYARALQLDPNCVRARLRMISAHIPVIAGSAAEIEASRAALAEELTGLEKWAAAADLPDHVELDASGHLFYLSYQEYCNIDLLVRYRGVCANLLARAAHEAPLEVIAYFAPASRTRLGIVSAHLFDHSVYKALVQGWLRGLDRSHIEILLFNVGVRRDADTAAAASLSDAYESGNRGTADWVDTIRRSALDALVFPEVGMDHVTLRLAAQRHAPLQLAAWGHPETTGLPTIDCYVSAQAFEPDDAQAHYCEQLVCLPKLGCLYEPYAITAADLDLAQLGISACVPMFICPGVPFKYNPQHDHVFADIAERLGACQFVFFEWSALALSARLHERLAAEFERRNLESSRYLRFIPWQERAGFFGLLQQADVYLDTIGFSGFNTAMQAVECTLPCVALEGRYLRGRLGSGVLRQMGLDELVAQDKASYVDLAVRLAQDGRYRNALRQKIRLYREKILADRDAVGALEQLLLDRADALRRRRA